MIKFIVLLFLSAQTVFAKSVVVPGGVFTPLFQDKGETDVRIVRLIVDDAPVTNEEFRLFVNANPRWAKAKVAPLLADASYLKNWSDESSFPMSIAKFPVVHVSWFAARAYCQAQGKRLPLMLEWEYFADTGSPEQEAETLKWYAKAQEQMKAVRTGKPNKFGLYDTTGLVWEWVDDYASAIMAGDSREGPMRDLFCGGASLNSKNPSRYGAFLRYALRASLKAQYTTSTLGFRCVKDFVKEKK